MGAELGGGGGGEAAGSSALGVAEATGSAGGGSAEGKGEATAFFLLRSSRIQVGVAGVGSFGIFGPVSTLRRPKREVVGACVGGGGGGARACGSGGPCCIGAP